MTIITIDGNTIEIDAGTLAIVNRSLVCGNGDTQTIIPLCAVHSVKEQNLGPIMTDEDIKKLDTLGAFDKMMLGEPDDSTGTIAEMPG